MSDLDQPGTITITNQNNAKALWSIAKFMAQVQGEVYASVSQSTGEQFLKIEVLLKKPAAGT